MIRKLFFIILFFISIDANAKDLTDKKGRTIVIKKPFERIISLYSAHTENLFCLGLNKEIIGVSESLDDKLGNKTIFSYHDDPEKFLSVNPDLVLIRPMIDYGYSKLISQLEKFGITVLSFQPQTLDEIYDYWKTLGKLTGKETQADGMISYFKKVVGIFNFLGLSVKDKKKVYFESIHNKMKTFSPDSIAIFVLETAGGINIAKDAEQVRDTNIASYGKEKILSHADEIDCYLAQFGTMNQPTINLIKNESGFQIIKAIKSNKVCIIDETIVSRPTLRLLNGIYEIGKCLYPEIFNEKIKMTFKNNGGCY